MLKETRLYTPPAAPTLPAELDREKFCKQVDEWLAYQFAVVEDLAAQRGNDPSTSVKLTT